MSTAAFGLAGDAVRKPVRPRFRHRNRMRDYRGRHKIALPRTAETTLYLRYFIDGELREWQPTLNMQYKRASPPKFAAFVRYYARMQIRTSRVHDSDFRFEHLPSVPAKTIVFHAAKCFMQEAAVFHGFLTPEVLQKARREERLRHAQPVVIIRAQTNERGHFLIAIPGPMPNFEVILFRKVKTGHLKEILSAHETVQFV